jgi:xylan 1,4-beta-xylosidase
MKVHNPVAGGFYPDPSVCRAGRNFYLVNSSFSYFPGLPVSRSTDLEHWTQIGNAIDRTEQLDFSGAGISRGLFAPCIRFHDGMFYIVCTQVDKLGNFIISAVDPAGPWSKPARICDQEGHCADGIDPSLFFDDDGTVWYIGTHERAGGCRYPGDYEVYIRQLDVNTGILSGKTYTVWDGALKNCIWPEGPHLYKKDGWYYVLAAEGGTGPDHAVMVARSKTLTGKYEGMPRNPLITHRHLGKNADIINVGHADLFDDAGGGWYMVLLASRPYGGSGRSEGERVSNMGRETFLVPVSWEDGWPVAAPGTGKIENVFELSETSFEKDGVSESGAVPERTLSFPVPSCTHFTVDTLPSNWLTLRKPLFSLTERSGCLRLYTCGTPLRTTGSVSFAGRRQCNMSYTFSCCMEFAPGHEDEEAGIVLLQSEDFQYRFAVCLGNKGTAVVRVIMACGSGQPDEVIAESSLDAGCSTIVLAVYADKQSLSFFSGTDMRRIQNVYSGADARILSTERAGGFVGTVLGVYASGSAAGGESSNHADVFWAEYDPVGE